MNLAASTYTVFATVLGVRYELSVTVRMGSYARFADNNQAVSPEQLAGMTAHTIATWQRVIEAVSNGSFEIAPFGDKAWPSAQAKQGVGIEETEPFVTVWNKEWNTKGLGVTVHSWDDGTTALFTAYSMLQGLDKIKEHAARFGIDKLEYAPASQSPKNAPNPAKSAKDINNMDEWLEPDTQATKASDYDNTGMQATQALRAYVRPAKAGSLPDTIKLQKGAKGKESFEMAIVPKAPYHAMNPQFQDKDLIAYPIMGKIAYRGDSKGFFMEIPVPQSSIRIRVKDATQYEGKLIESDWQKIIKHMGLETHTITEGQVFEVPATHIALKAGKLGKDEHGNETQWKNYVGFYVLD